MVESNDLTNQLGALGHNTRVDGLINRFKAVTESLVQIANAVKLSVVGTHHSTIITKQLLACVTEEFQLLAMQHAHLGNCNVRILKAAKR